jgi:FdhD protein
MSHRTRGRPVLHIRAGRLHPDAASDTVAHEEPLELRLDGRVLTTTMRTPGEDVDLAHGWLLAEGIVTAAEDVVSARFNLGVDGDDGLNVLDVVLGEEVDAPPAARVRLGTTTASCGICGTSAVDAMTLSHVVSR